MAPSAAYRHFADPRALLDAVCSAAQAALAVAIGGELAGLPGDGDPAEVARARLRGVGTGYLRFARAEPGMFRTAFSASEILRSAASPARAGEGGLTPFQLLGSALGASPTGVRESTPRCAGSVVVLEARPRFFERQLRVSTDVDL